MKSKIKAPAVECHSVPFGSCYWLLLPVVLSESRHTDSDTDTAISKLRKPDSALLSAAVIIDRFISGLSLLASESVCCVMQQSKGPRVAHRRKVQHTQSEK